MAPHLQVIDESLEGSGLFLRIQAAAEAALKVEADYYTESVDDELGGGGVVAADGAGGGGDHVLVRVAGTEGFFHSSPLTCRMVGMSGLPLRHIVRDGINGPVVFDSHRDYLPATPTNTSMEPTCAICGLPLGSGERNVRIVSQGPGWTVQQQWHTTCGPLDWRSDEDEPLPEGDIDVGHFTVKFD